MSLTLNFVYCFTGFIGGLIFHVRQYAFQNHVKSRKIYVWATRYNYTHDQLNAIDISISFLRILLRGGGGAQNLTLPPGASYPRYATAPPTLSRRSSG